MAASRMANSAASEMLLHFVLTVNFCALELSRGYARFEQQIDLAERSILGLGQAEPAPYQAERIRPSVEPSGVGAPVPSG